MVGVKGQVQRRGVDRRAAVVGAAIDLFAQSGYRRTSVAAIARRAGIAPSGVIHHFGSKLGLLRAVFEELEGRKTAFVEEIVAEGGLAMLRQLGEYGRLTASVAPNLSLTTLILTVENIAEDTPEHQFILERRRHNRALLRQGLERGIARGELRSDFDVERKAEEMHAFMFGVQLYSLLDPDVSSIRLHEGYFVALAEDLAAPATR